MGEGIAGTRVPVGHSLAVRLSPRLGIEDGTRMRVREERGRDIAEPVDMPSRRLDPTGIWGSCRWPAATSAGNAGAGEAVTSAICGAEPAVAPGNEDATSRGMMERACRLIEPVPFARATAARFGTLPSRRGRSDRPIAARARSLWLTRVVEEECDVAGTPGLAVEMWTR